jgi:signal transduction histidine kinase
VLIYVLPFSLMLSLGGFIPDSAVMIWAILAPIGALWGSKSKEAGAWTLAFLGGTVFSGLVGPLLRDSNNLPDAVITTFFVLNIGLVCGVLSALVAFYVRQMDALIDVMRRNRELESAYLDQEVSLRQSDKLATLGKLSAGLAHELNNPAAAAQQASKRLETLLLSSQLRSVERSGLALGQRENDALETFSERIREAIDKPQFTDPLDRSDRETEMQDRLEDLGVPEPWDVASSLVNLGVTGVELDELRSTLSPEKLVDVLTLISVRFTRQHLIGGLKESTLVMLEHRLKAGVVVERFYGEGVPAIEANGSELNQVWTNLLDNAIDAMGGEGRIEIITMWDGTFVVVQIVDDGPGIPDGIVDTIFDPFVNSKAPGEGTGLGLNIVHNLGDVVQRWRSLPGRVAYRHRFLRGARQSCSRWRSTIRSTATSSSASCRASAPRFGGSSRTAVALNRKPPCGAGTVSVSSSSMLT